MKLVIFAFASLAGIIHAQLDYLDAPLLKFETNTVPPVGPGCGAYVTPDDRMVVVTSSNSQISAFDVDTGKVIFTFNPSDTDRRGYPTYCTSGVSFGTFNEKKYLVTGISYGYPKTNVTFCQIVALLPDGKPFWKSSIFDGACSGTPVVGEDGTLVYFTRNTATTGSFTILSAGLNGTAYFNNFTEPRPFAPPGIYHNPTEGYYLGGDGNSNDIVIFSNTAFYGETTVGVGSLFAFQSPLFGQQPSVTLLNNATTWYSFSPPKITNNGYSMYIPVSRSQLRAWVGAAGDNLNQFHRLPTATIQFPRGNPAWLAPYASVALSSSPTKPMVFGGTAAYLMVGYTFDMKEMWKVASTSNIRAEAKVSPQDDRVYWVEENSKVHCTNTTSGSEIWAIKLSFAPVRSDFAQTSDGSSLFFTDVAGNLIALSVAVAPSHAPTTQAVGTPSKAPSTSPTTAFPTNVPISSAPSTAPSTVALVTQAPILGASAAPSVDTPVPTVPPTTGSIARTLVPTGLKTQVTTSEKLSGAGVKATYSCVTVFFAFLLF